MLDLHTQALGLKPILWDALAPAVAPEPARRRTPTRRCCARWYELMLDEIDYGVLLLGRDAQVLHMNHAARCELDAQHPLQLLGRQLRRARRRRCGAAARCAEAAAQRGLRRLLMLGQDGHRVAVSVVPLRSGGPSGAARHPAVDGQAPDVRRPGRAVVRAQPRR